MSDADRELVRRAREGDQAAYRALVERYQRRVFSLALTLLKDRDDAADVAQETFLKAYQGLSSFKGEAGFYTWLYRIANNLAIDLIRRRGHTVREEIDEELLDPEAAQACEGLLATRLGVDPAEEAMRHELGETLERALAELPEKHRAILILREVEGLSYEELSLALDIPKGTVMSRLFHARAKMQRLLTGELSAGAEGAPVNVAGAVASKP